MSDNKKYSSSERTLLYLGIILGGSAGGAAILRKIVGGSNFTSALAQTSGALLGGLVGKKIVDEFKNQKSKD